MLARRNQPGRDSDGLAAEYSITLEGIIMSSTFKRLALLGLPLALLAQSVGAQQDELQKKYQKKITEAWFTKGGWVDDYAAVKARAKKEGKVIFAYFTRSYSP